MQNKSKASMTAPAVVSASKVIGEGVINRNHESLGKVNELVIDADRGSLAYVVLSFGGFMGVGNKLFAIPWQAFEFSPTEYKLILNVDKDKLKNAPGFDKDDWPDFADRTWGESIHDFYGYRANWK